MIWSTNVVGQFARVAIEQSRTFWPSQLHDVVTALYDYMSKSPKFKPKPSPSIVGLPWLVATIGQAELFALIKDFVAGSPVVQSWLDSNSMLERDHYGTETLVSNVVRAVWDAAHAPQTDARVVVTPQAKSKTPESETRARGSAARDQTGRYEPKVEKEAKRRRADCQHLWEDAGIERMSHTLIRVIKTCPYCDSYTYREALFIGYRQDGLEDRIDSALEGE